MIFIFIKYLRTFVIPNRNKKHKNYELTNLSNNHFGSISSYHYVSSYKIQKRCCNECNISSIYPYCNFILYNVIYLNHLKQLSIMYLYKLSSVYTGKTEIVECQHDAEALKKLWATDVYLKGNIMAVRTEYLKPLYDKVQRTTK